MRENEVEEEVWICREGVERERVRIEFVRENEFGACVRFVRENGMGENE